MTFSLSHASPSQLSSPTKKNTIIKKSLLLFLHAVTNSLRLQESVVPFYVSSSSSTGTNKAESSLRLHWQLRIASESHSSSGRFIPLPPFVPCFIHCRCTLSSSFSESWFLFYLPNFFSFAQFNSVLLCFFVCP